MISHVLTALFAVLPAAGPQEPPLLGLVTTPDGRPLVGAEVVARAVAPHQLAILQGLGTPGSTVRTTTDRRGAYRLPAGSGPHVLMVRDSSGLGAISMAYPGAAERLLAEPMAAVAGSLPMKAWLRLAWSAPGTGFLPVLSGVPRGASLRNAELRLPPGPYQGWIASGLALGWQRLHAGSGRRLELGLTLDDGTPWRWRRVVLWEGFEGRVTPHGWPEVDLPRTGPRTYAVPERVSRLQIREAADGGEVWTDVWVPPWTPAAGAPGPDRAGGDLPDPPVLRLERPARQRLRIRVLDPEQRAVAGAEVWALADTAQGVRALGRVVSDTEGSAVLVLGGVQPWGPAPDPEPPGSPGRDPQGAQPDPGLRVLAVHPDFAAATARPSPETTELALELLAGRVVVVSVEGPDGPGVAGARLELGPHDDPDVGLSAHTDGRGLARFDRVPPGPVELRMLDPRFLPVSRTLTEVRAPVRLAARPGEAIAGQVVMASGEPVERALVSLRDPAGGPLAERTVAADAAGRFRFTGLEPRVSLVLFATLERDGSTWSRRLSDVRAGDTRVQVELRLEDPPPPHRRGRRGG